jgi:hypothetical protein
MNATFDNGTIKAFNFTGAYTSNVTTSDHGLGTGDVTYTVSYWFKRIQQRNNYDYLYIMGNGGTTGQASLMWILNDELHLDHWGTATKYNEPIQNNRWYHVTVGHKGGQAVTNDFLYIDGQNVGVGVSTPATFNLQGAKLTLGTSHNTTNEFLEGSIANFRIFNRALTTDDIYQLYAYQKEYFGHGDLSMTLKAGRLGIGTSEPRAMLDVRGDVILTGNFSQIITGIGRVPIMGRISNTFLTTSASILISSLPENVDIDRMKTAAYGAIVMMTGDNISATGDRARGSYMFKGEVSQSSTHIELVYGFFDGTYTKIAALRYDIGSDSKSITVYQTLAQYHTGDSTNRYDLGTWTTVNSPGSTNYGVKDLTIFY